jgi:hypothetical protein
MRRFKSMASARCRLLVSEQVPVCSCLCLMVLENLAVEECGFQLLSTKNLWKTRIGKTTSVQLDSLPSESAC